jgi:hypothetical protein
MGSAIRCAEWTEERRGRSSQSPTHNLGGAYSLKQTAACLDPAGPLSDPRAGYGPDPIYPTSHLARFSRLGIGRLGPPKKKKRKGCAGEQTNAERPRDAHAERRWSLAALLVLRSRLGPERRQGIGVRRERGPSLGGCVWLLISVWAHDEAWIGSSPRRWSPGRSASADERRRSRADDAGSLGRSRDRRLWRGSDGSGHVRLEEDRHSRVDRA